MLCYQALKLYTDSIRFAPYTGEGVGEELGLGLANRSAVLAQCKDYRLVVMSVQCSVSCLIG